MPEVARDWTEPAEGAPDQGYACGTCGGAFATVEDLEAHDCEGNLAEKLAAVDDRLEAIEATLVRVDQRLSRLEQGLSG